MDPIWHARATRQCNDRPFLDFGDQERDFVVFLGRFAAEDDLEVIVRKNLPKASNQQNRYYRGVIVKIISEYTGHTPDEIHNILKWKFLKRTDDNRFEYVPSTMDLSTADRERYHEDCRLWANVVLGLNIPEPNQFEPGE